MALVVVDQCNSARNNSVSIDAHFLQIRRDKSAWEIFNGATKISVSTDRCDFISGDTLLIDGCFERPINTSAPFLFNYVDYLNKIGVYSVARVRPQQIIVVGRANPNSVMALSYKINNRLTSIINNSNLSPKNRSLISALLWGDKSQLDKQTKLEFASAGLMHVLAVSGLHTGIIFVIINCFFGILKRRKLGRFLFAFIGISLLWSYAIITGLAPSVARAAFMFSILIIGESIDRKGISLNSVGLAAVVLFLLDPRVILGLSFQLSFAAVTSISLAMPLYRWIRTPFFAVNLLLQIVFISIVATLGTLPITLYNFGQFPTLFLLSNVVILPFLPIVIYLGMASVVLELLIPGVSFLWEILEFLLSQFVNFVSWISSFPFALIEGITIYWLAAIFLGVSVFLLFVWLSYQNRKAIFFSLTTFILALVINNSYWLANKNSINLGFYLSSNNVATVAKSSAQLHIINGSGKSQSNLIFYANTQKLKFVEHRINGNSWVSIGTTKMLYVDNVRSFDKLQVAVGECDVVLLNQIVDVDKTIEFLKGYKGILIVGSVINPLEIINFAERLDRININYSMLKNDGVYLSPL